MLLANLFKESTEGTDWLPVCAFHYSDVLSFSGRCSSSLTLDLLSSKGYTPTNPIPGRHALNVTVPGTAAGWADTIEKFGSGKVSFPPKNMMKFYISLLTSTSYPLPSPLLPSPPLFSPPLPSSPLPSPLLPSPPLFSPPLFSPPLPSSPLPSPLLPSPPLPFPSLPSSPFPHPSPLPSLALPTPSFHCSRYSNLP